jgi:hypothetical protein
LVGAQKVPKYRPPTSAMEAKLVGLAGIEPAT